MPPKFGHINQRLTDIAIKYPTEEFVGNVLFPEMPVNKGSDLYTLFSRENLFKNVDDTISKRGQARDILIDSATAEYFVKNRALKGFVAKEDLDNADDPLEPKADTVEAVTRAVLLQREIRHAALAQSLTVNTSSPVTKWDQPNSTPIDDIEAAANAMWVRPNLLVFSLPVWNSLKFHAQIIAHFGGGNPSLKKVTQAMVAELFEVDRVVIAAARQNANKDPQAGDYSRIWGKGTHLAYVDQRKGRDVFTFGKTFAQKINGSRTFQVREWDDPSRGVGGGTWTQVEHRSIEKVISEDAGYYLSACIS